MKLKLPLRIQLVLQLLTVILLGSSAPFLSSSAQELRCQGIHRPQNFKKTESALSTLTAKADYILKTYPTGSPDYFSAWQMSSQIMKLSYDEQQQWVNAIGQTYRRIPKKDPNPMAKKHIGGRRLLDLIVNRVENYRDRFQSRIEQEGISPQRAYQEYLSHQSEVFGTHYSSKEVEMVILFIQAQLKALEKIYPGAPLTVRMGGSFPNGKADLMTSDIDLSLSDAGAYKWMQYWQPKLNQTFQTAGILAKVELGFSTEPTSFYGSINPVVLQISSSRVELLVFPVGQPLPGEASLQSGSPLVYEWK